MASDPAILDLLDAIQELEPKAEELAAKRDKLATLRSYCKHTWLASQRRNEYHPAYRIPSDQERGIELGVDSQPACNVPARDEVWWERECSKCGKIEKTTETRPTGQGPVWWG